MAWTKQQIKEGLEKYYNEFGRYPTAHEIDKYPYLPSSRQIQRRFGGLPEIRKQLGIQIVDYTRGDVRSNKAEVIGRRGLNYEKDVQKILVNHFGEIFVHEQKPFNDYAGRLDFFVYAKNEKFGVDVFYAEDIHSLTGCINYKQKSYKGFSDKLVFLQINPNIAQKELNKFIQTKKNTLFDNVMVMDLDHFKKWIISIKTLRVF